MKQVKALVLSGYGINCEMEMAKGVELAGGDVEIAHAKTWLLGHISLQNFDFLLFPGGFSFGDELGAAKAFANRIAFSKRTDELFAFIEKGGCILGVCNGFQLLVKLGILPGFKKKSEAALIRNSKGRFESRWVHQKVIRGPSIFTSGITDLYLPVRHGEGNFIMPDAIETLLCENRVVLQYASSNGEMSESYPQNPNGSSKSIAGICDSTGRVLGMMPHPEAALFFTQLPFWTRQKEEIKRKGEKVPFFGPGIALFKNAIEYLRRR